jgi:glutaminase
MTYEHISTGRLPSGAEVQALVDDAHQRFRAVDDGTNSTVYPALQRADPTHFGLSVVGAAGIAYEAGDVHVPFTIMSVAKPFVFALVCEAIGADEVKRLIGVNATGMPFNSLEAIERSAGGRTNPMVNSGAIATAGLVPGSTTEAKWAAVLDGLSRFAGRSLELDQEVFESASATNHRNQAIARLLDAMGAMPFDPAATVDVYTRQSCLSVTAHDLAVMGATLASGGVNPVTGERVVRADTCHDVLTVMTIAGLYETSGDWLYEVGVPGKSGIGGGIVTVSPGKGGLGTYSPPLDAAGNSVRGQLAARHLSRRLGLDLFVSPTPASS